MYEHEHACRKACYAFHASCMHMRKNSRQIGRRKPLFSCACEGGEGEGGRRKVRKSDPLAVLSEDAPTTCRSILRESGQWIRRWRLVLRTSLQPPSPFCFVVRNSKPEIKQTKKDKKLSSVKMFCDAVISTTSRHCDTFWEKE